MGNTMVCVWQHEFTRLMYGDRLFYRRMHMFPRELRDRFPRLREMLRERETMKGIIARNTGINKSEIPADVFRSTV